VTTHHRIIEQPAAQVRIRLFLKWLHIALCEDVLVEEVFTGVLGNVAADRCEAAGSSIVVVLGMIGCRRAADSTVFIVVD
jgi:hypothetical protein